MNRRDPATDLMTLVAEALSGRSCLVRWADPGGGRLGCCYRDGDTARIDLAHGLRGPKLLDVFLHEVAHARHDIPVLADVKGKRDPAPARLTARQVRQLADMDRRANEQAARWARYAAQEAPGGTVGDQLAALISYTEGERAPRVLP